MITNKVGNLQVQTAGRKSSHFPLPHTLNTTARFGEIQPIQCLKRAPKSSYKCNSRTIIRALPLVAPVSAGTIKAKVYHKFVSISDLLQKWPSYLTSAPMGTALGVATMDHPPLSTLRDLSFFCLVGCKVTCYVLDTSNQTSSSDPLSVDSAQTKWVALNSGTDANIVVTVLQSNGALTLHGSPASSLIETDFSTRFPNFIQGPSALAMRLNLLSPAFPVVHVPVFNQSNSLASMFHLDNSYSVKVDIRTADFVFTRNFDAGSATGIGVDPADGQLKCAFAVQMSDIGLRWYKVLVGLGYKPDFASVTPIEITRIFAFYKAYFDSFGLTYWTNYESSYAYMLLQMYDQMVITQGLNWNTTPQQQNNMFISFMTDCANCYVTDPLDYISAHRIEDVTAPGQSANAGFVSNIVTSSGGNAFYTGDNDSADHPPSPYAVGTHTKSIYINKITHTQVDADLLKILYRSVNVQTAAGKRLEELLRAGGYGEWLAEQKSSFIGMDEIELDITDINATSDSTNTVTGKDSTLGQTVGKGLAVRSASKDSYHEFHNEEFGYWITLMAFVPESSYVQGVDQTIYDVDKFDEYQPDYDAIGYELQRKSVVASGGDWYSITSAYNRSQSDDAFGQVPRMTRYKVAQSIVNGGFLRRSQRDYFLNYCLDRFIHFNDRAEIDKPVNGTYGYVYTLGKYSDCNQLPLAGVAWRYCNRYPWLASFDRIFTYIGAAYMIGGLTAYGVASAEARWMYCSFGEDGFMLFIQFLASGEAKMLPLEKSWSTLDDPDSEDGVPMRQA